MSYSLDFLRKVLKVRSEEGSSLAKVSKRFDVGLATVMRWTKSITLKTKRDKPATKINMETLRSDVENYPDAYHYEGAQRFGVSKNGVWHALKRLGVTYKKNPQAPQKQARRTTYLPTKNPSTR
ncbi:MAG: transposase [Holosporales bacterium]|nr:transposase [Holosporales bacterium]